MLEGAVAHALSMAPVSNTARVPRIRLSRCEMQGGSHEVGGPFQGKMADSSRFRVNFARFL